MNLFSWKSNKLCKWLIAEWMSTPMRSTEDDNRLSVAECAVTTSAQKRLSALKKLHRDEMEASTLTEENLYGAGIDDYISIKKIHFNLIQIFIWNFERVFLKTTFFKTITIISSKRVAPFDTLQLPTSHSQRLNSRKSLGIGCCEWPWSITTWINGTLLIIDWKWSQKMFHVLPGSSNGITCIISSAY